MASAGKDGSQPGPPPEPDVTAINATSDHYEVLQLNRDASLEDIKRAYRHLALKLHPDKNQTPGAEEAFKRVANAFQVLGDPNKRALYDLRGDDDPRASPSQESSPADVFNTFFGGAAPGGVFGVTQFDRELLSQMHRQQADEARARAPPAPKRKKAKAKRHKPIGWGVVGGGLLKLALLPVHTAKALVSYGVTNNLGRLILIGSIGVAGEVYRKERKKRLDNAAPWHKGRDYIWKKFK